MAFVFRFLKSMLLVVLLAAGTSALAQTPGNGEPLTDGVAGEWQQILDRVSERLQNKRLSEEDRLLLRRQIEYVFQEAQEEAKKVREEAVSAAQLLAALGPGPKEGEPPEAGEIARKRQALTRHLTRIKGHIKQAEFSAVRAERLIQRMVKTQQSRLWDRLLKMEPSPLLPAVWAQAIPEFREIILAFLTAPIEWAQSDELAGRWKQSVWVVLGALVISILIGWPLRVWLLRRYGHVPSLEEPSYARRLLAAVVEGVARGLLPSLAVVAVLVVMLSLGLLDGLFGAIVTVAITNLVIFVVVAALANAAFTPHLPNWRVTNFSDESSKRASHRIIALTAVFAITNTLS
ncbi:MAG: DUF3772 domain-containing protein, partial [Rhodospirillales bacterium]|nr:DUF3772 domain-containing protein [Rhodospirillales bacterium]